MLSGSREELQGRRVRIRSDSGHRTDGEENMNYVAADGDVPPIFIEEMSRELSPKDVISLFKIFREICCGKSRTSFTRTPQRPEPSDEPPLWLTSLRARVPGSAGGPKIVHTFHGHVFHSYTTAKRRRVFHRDRKDPCQIRDRQDHHDLAVSSLTRSEAMSGSAAATVRDHSAWDRRRSDLEADVDEREAFRERNRSACRRQLLVGFVGRLTEIKDISMFIKAAACGPQFGEASSRDSDL